MSQLALWLMSLAIDAQRARDTTFPDSADSPVVLHCLVVVSAAVAAWIGWDTTPTRAYCPTLSLFSRTLDRTAVMTYGAHLLPDRAFLDRPLEVTPAVLAMEMEDLRSQFRLLTKPMLEWRRQAPGHLAAGHDRLLLAVIQACQEFTYYEGAPVLTVIAEQL